MNKKQQQKQQPTPTSIGNFWYVKHALNFLSFQNFMCLFFALVFTLFPVTTELIDITIIKATKNNNISNQI